MRRRLSIAIALALAGAAGAASAQQAAEPFAESVLQVTINGEHLPSALLVRRDADGTLLREGVRPQGTQAQDAGDRRDAGQRPALLPDRQGDRRHRHVRRRDAERGRQPAAPGVRRDQDPPRFGRRAVEGAGPARRLRELRRLGGTQQRPHERRRLRRVRAVRREGRAHGNGRGTQRLERTRTPRDSTRRGRATSPTAW